MILQRNDPAEAVPVVVSADAALVDELLRLAAAAGVVAEVVGTAAEAVRRWAVAPLLLVGADLVTEVAAYRPSRRPGVHLVATGHVPDPLFRDAIDLGVETVAVLPDAADRLTETITDLADGPAGQGVTVGVVGGSGGAGASVLAAAIAECAASTARTLLVDTDVFGAGLDHILGTDTLDGVRWDALGFTAGRLSARSLRSALPTRDGLSVLTWTPGAVAAVPPEAMREVLSAGRRGFDMVVVDLPRRPDPVIDEVIARCDHVVLVVRLTVPGVVAATRIVPHLPPPPRTGLVVRGGTGGVPGPEAARVLGLPLSASMSDQRGLDEAIGLGAGPVRSRRGILARTATEIGRRLLAGGAP